MSRRKLTGLSGKQIVRAPQKAGFEILRISGSHHILAKPGSPGARVIVPVHGARDLPPGTVRSIVVQSNLSIEEFLSLI